jgi:hypothetical protein
MKAISMMTAATTNRLVEMGRAGYPRAAR